MRDLYILGGEMRSDAAKSQEWQRYVKAVVVKANAETREAVRVHDYFSPPEACPDQPSVLFKAGTLVGDRLYTCTQTEVIVYRLPNFEIEHYVSLPCFNDLHHVMPTDRGTLLVAVTGLDIIVEVDTDGALLNEWDVLGADTWARFSRDEDYRKMPSTKPHQAHPNFVFTLGDEIWTTRCDLKDAVCLTDREKRIDLSGEGFHPVQVVHDGLLHDGKLFFTAVDGNVLIADPQTCQVTEIVNLRDIVESEYPLGWCRGIEVLDEDRVIVGFSKLRQTKLQDKVRWAKAQVKRISGMDDYDKSLPSLPTRICCFNLRSRKQEWELPLTDLGIDAVFSVL
ncbi:MAG: hypothetical protein GKS00_29990 [Alphaproteobacteria bacterium]|nr:hypothetical protein [Alphaproteobacteria bacterium]